MKHETTKPPAEEVKRQLAMLLNYHSLSMRSADAALRRAMSEWNELEPTS